MEFTPQELKNLCSEGVTNPDSSAVWKADIIKKNKFRYETKGLHAITLFNAEALASLPNVGPEIKK